ncbi:hypothetical protein J6590_054287 [Homalodisca vitripennis]|nr:hypothetical protein J6590_054287 [Homalodisca vitripennis]
MFLKPYVTAKGNDQPSNLPPLTSAVDDSSTVDNTKGERVDDVVPLEEEPVEEGQSYLTPHPPKKAEKPVNADAVVMDYIKSKKSVASDNPRKQFLMSLLPDIEKMTAPQFKKFRREVLNLIDQVAEPGWSTYHQSSFSPISTQSWSGESSESASTANQLLRSHTYSVEENSQSSELAPFITSKPF